MKTLILSILISALPIVVQAEYKSITNDLTAPYLSLNTNSFQLSLSKSVLQNSDLEFLSHKGSAPMQNALAMNVQYEPVKSLRRQLESILKKN